MTPPPTPTTPSPDTRYCMHCGAELTPGARFCHRCGTASGTVGPQMVAGSPRGGGGLATALPWGIAAIALVALIAYGAGQRFGARPGQTLDAPSNALPQAALGDPGAAPFAGGADPSADASAAPFAGGAAGGGRAPDISNMSPQERAARLFDRVIRYDEQGKQDSLRVFAPMAIVAYQMLPSMNADERYDLGRIGEVTGDFAIAKAQADTILRANPTHLLALALRARMSAQPAERQQYEQRLMAAAPAELRKGLPEYDTHRVDIDSAMAKIRRGNGAR